jgi:two-component system phosphate regulon sensor histidine kinase PhoR
MLARVAAARWIVIAAAAVLLLLSGLGRIGLLEALLTLAVLIVAAMLPVRMDSPPLAAALVARPRNFAPVDPQLAALVAALPDASLLIDRQGRILVGNIAAENMLGPIRYNEPISFTVRVPEILEAVRAAADGTPRRIEFTERVPVERTFEVHVVPVSFGLAGAAGLSASEILLLSFRDLTHQRRIDQMRADFVANASHELRTPLASLSGFIETLQGPARDDAEARARFLEIMVEQARRMSRLIEDLLSLSRIELNEHLRPESIVDVVPVIDHVCETLAPLARERGVVLEFKKNANELLVRGERDELIRLFENLVENALKYGASGKRVEVAVGADTSEGAADAIVSVRDFGPGIAPEHLPRLTERFYRVDAEASRAQGGTGLGLAIVKHILARHRGRLAIASQLGQGSNFVARVPLSTAAEPQKETAPAG